MTTGKQSSLAQLEKQKEEETQTKKQNWLENCEKSFQKLRQEMQNWLNQGEGI